MSPPRSESTQSMLLFVLLFFLVLAGEVLAEHSSEKANAINRAADELTDLLLPEASRVSIGFQNSDTTAIGDLKVIEVTSDITGRLILIDIDANGDIVQLYPNKHVFPEHGNIAAGETKVIPDNSSYRFRAGEPAGRSRLLAIVTPGNFDSSALVNNPSRITNELAVEADPQGYLQTLYNQIRKATGRSDKSLRIESVTPSVGWAFASKDYFVTDNTKSGYLEDDEHPTSQIFLEGEDKSLELSGKPIREVYTKGLSLTKLSEGFRLRMYNDAARYCTIGYGHLIMKAPCDGTPEEFSQGISKSKGEDILKTDMRRAKLAVSRLTEAELTDGQYAALTDFTFNVGTKNYKKSTLRKLVNQGKRTQIPAEFRKWAKAGGKVFTGLQIRREREIALFFDGEAIPTTKSIGAGEMIDIELGELEK